MAADYETNVWAFYRYEPSMVAAVIFILLFSVSTSLHMYQLIRTRTLYFIPFLIGGFLESIGYVGRALSSTQTPDWTLSPYIMQAMALLIAPALFAASIYMSLGRIILLVDGEAHSIIRKKWLTKVFVTGDVLSFCMQSAGGGIMAAGTLDAMERGEKIVIGGLFLQIIFFGFFVVTTVIFHYRLNKVPTTRSKETDVPWRQHMLALYGTSFLILFRSIFRVVEYLQGNDGYLLRKEVFLYIFDAIPMLVVMLWFNWVHPSQIKAALRGGKWINAGYRLQDMEMLR
ncbi:hypothetical protein W97_01154 [Coniosporium apollinis CBS 100218]|uniref:RTA1 like protein n=1 Tax=Coniosporium apollinis (strain CBS 100218) TaxID=1168221 RepID=R7YJV8_CONA1|nr:uncharacterized protein W97_01154 [Coniosporium apollinis CBS 100218]EON61936.1 hypothetical protein W97_01154 [Coniosporium apollinis CBS 100218]